MIENFSSRVLRNWGLGYDVLREIKPDIVYVSMSGYGHTGRHHHYTTFGPVAQAVSGLTHLSGLPDKPPAGWGWSYMDDTGGMYGAMCALTGLYHRNMTGQGQHIDLSQMVSSVPLNRSGAARFHGQRARLAAGRVSSRQPRPLARHARREQLPRARPWRRTTPIAPTPAGTTTGASSSVTPTRNGSVWCEVMGAPSWAMSAKFATVTGRLQHQEELDSGIEAWTLTLGKYEVTERCQAAGVRALAGAERRGPGRA